MTQLDTVTVWALVVGLSLGTYLLRASFLLGVDRIGGLPRSLERVLPFVPTAVLAALVAPNLVVDGTMSLGPGNVRLLAGAVAVVVAWRTKSMLWTVGVGMVALWTLQLLGVA